MGTLKNAPFGKNVYGHKKHGKHCGKFLYFFEKISCSREEIIMENENEH